MTHQTYQSWADCWWCLGKGVSLIPPHRATAIMASEDQGCAFVPRNSAHCVVREGLGAGTSQKPADCSSLRISLFWLHPICAGFCTTCKRKSYRNKCTPCHWQDLAMLGALCIPHNSPAAHFPAEETDRKRVYDSSKLLQLISGSQVSDKVCLPSPHAVSGRAPCTFSEPQIPHLQNGNKNIELIGVGGVGIFKNANRWTD